MKKILWTAGLFASLLAGCKDPSEEFDGPGGCRRQPVVYGGTRFADDNLSISIEAMAKSEETEPRIIEVELYADGAKVPVPHAVIHRSKGKYGFYQTCSFQAPPGARAVQVILVVHHLNSLFRMEVPFELDPESRATNKWIMRKETVREVGTQAMSGPNPPPAEAP
jgi:hypothetical protein